MNRASRRVRRVRLRAENAAAARRGLLLLEDALHTAALPDAGGRLLIVRRLDVGAIDPHAGPNCVALAVEVRLRTLARHAVAADDPAAVQTATHAGAVTFRDAVAPCTALALRLARGEAVDAWFWPLAVAGWRADLPRAPGLRRVILHAAALLPQGAGARAVAGALVQAGLAGALFSALEPGDGPRLLALHGIAPGRFAPLARPAPHPPAARAASLAHAAQDATARVPPSMRQVAVHLKPHWRAALAAASQQWGAEDARLHWLALAAVGEAAPGLLLSPAAVVQAAEQVAAGIAAAQSSAVPGAPPARRHREHATPPSLEPNIISTPGLPAGGATMQPQTAEFAPERGSLPTAGGGLLFTLSLLDRLGFAAWLGDRPAFATARLPERLLLLLAQGARLPPDDPLAAWLAGTLDGAPTAEGADDACRLWRAGLHGWLVRRAHMTLCDLILRPGTVSITPTHVDVTFDLAQADPRVRRLGLDVDPGWVAWLGRVVRFQYSDGTTEQ